MTICLMNNMTKIIHCFLLISCIWRASSFFFGGGIAPNVCAYAKCAPDISFFALENLLTAPEAWRVDAAASLQTQKTLPKKTARICRRPRAVIRPQRISVVGRCWLPAHLMPFSSIVFRLSRPPPAFKHYCILRQNFNASIFKFPAYQSGSNDRTQLLRFEANAKSKSRTIYL